ncbi:MAG: hypothetical protein ACP5E3_07715 [Bacteroidales bacterium]
MKLEKVLSLLNSFEKNSFLKIIDNILAKNPKNANKIDVILSEGSKELKNIDNINITNIFNLVENEFTDCIKQEFLNLESQLDILTRDGRCIAKHDWFSKMYENEINRFKKNTAKFVKNLKAEDSTIEPLRKRVCDIYKACTQYNELMIYFYS